MGIILVLFLLIFVTLLIRYRKFKIRWLLVLIILVVSSITTWYFMPFHIPLEERLNANSVSIRLSNRGADDVDITDTSISVDIIDILSDTKYQRREFLGTFFTGGSMVSVENYVRIYFVDDANLFYEFILSDVDRVESSLNITNGNRSYKILNASELIKEIDELL